MILNGQLDFILSSTQGQYLLFSVTNNSSLVEGTINSMKWAGSSEFPKSKKVIWKVKKEDTEVAGYVRQVKNFTQAIVRMAGHMVPAGIF